MNLKHMEALVWICRLGSFSAAARRLNTTQPAISMRIAELEKRLGIALFDRRARALHITPEGREFADYAHRIVDLVQEAEGRMSDRSQLSGRLKLGVTESVALTWLSDLVVRLNEEFPAILIDLDINLTQIVWRKLRDGELDLAILPGPAFGSDLSITYLGSILYTWMASPKLKLVNADGQLSANDFNRVPVITLSEDSNLHEIIETWFSSNSSAPRRVDVCNSLGVVAELTMAGLGISMLPPIIFSDEIERGDLFELKTKPDIKPLEFWAVQTSRHVSPITETIAQYARQASTFRFA
ncbi:LysR substrate-binding domain-containing protein [Anderseniella sp. Alg231-50]|uniref:LysR substrate-binding domain-containing protein n=1 Tax=Anderseniella sp. Alg231-50 TaxID=1922226 RepID=UPI000D55D595